MWNSEPKSAAHQAPAKTLGMTSAISMAEPKPEDHTATSDLSVAMEPYNVFESDAELNHRMEILAKLNTLVKEWIRDVSVAKNMPAQMADKVGGKIYTFGSYRLGVHHKGADIDALCVAPSNIDRADYFSTFIEILKKQPEVTECRVSFSVGFYYWNTHAITTFLFGMRLSCRLSKRPMCRSSK